MRILALADVPDKQLWDYLNRSLLEGVDLILSAGDLPADYLSFLTCFTHAPIFYIHGNHDAKYAKKPPEGCVCIEDKIVKIGGVRILGLGGSMRYKPGDCMYSEKEMRKRIRKLWFSLFRNRGFDILLTHAPAFGLGDKETLPHRGFQCFLDLMDKYAPKFLIHGHVHKEYSAFFEREHTYNQTRVINANGRVFLEIDPVK